MPDLEKVINQIDVDIQRAERTGEMLVYVGLKTAKDALALLKEQEAKEQCLKTKCIICPHCDNCDVDENGLLKEQKAVKIEVKKINDSGRCGRCPNCLMELNEMDYPNWCGYCGQKVKWNG